MGWSETGAAAAGSSPCGDRHAIGYPSFCDIPRAPTDVRSAKAFRTAVIDLRRAGRRVVRATGPDTFGLPEGQADAFSRDAQAEAAPPSEAGAPSTETSEAAAADLRRRATPPPPRPHR